MQKFSSSQQKIPMKPPLAQVKLLSIQTSLEDLETEANNKITNVALLDRMAKCRQEILALLNVLKAF